MNDRSGDHSSSLLIRNATIVTMNDRFEVLTGAVSIHGGRIESVGTEPPQAHDQVIDGSGCYLLPGFVQTHIHLCQTLFRGYADDLRLLDWLRTRVWPLEAAHTPASLQAAARVACVELIGSGTTTVLTMETVHDTHAVFEAVGEMGIRATIGKSMMDVALPETPSRLRETRRASIEESLALYRGFHHSHDGRLRAAFAPRFVVSCSRELLEEVAAVSARDSLLVHTHASEQRDEIALVRKATGMSNIEYFEATGLASPRLCTAHAIWVDHREQGLLAEHDVKVSHCPGSNLKLGSGIAPVPEMLERGICVSLGSDGAACNNHLDMFGEMRLAATLQAMRRAPGALTARQALWMATRNGARALGLEREIGSIEVGKRADVILIDTANAHTTPAPDPFSTIVYATRPDDVRATIIDGKVLMLDGVLLHADVDAIVNAAASEATQLRRRAGL